MPPYGNLSDAQLQSMALYLLSLVGKAPTPAPVTPANAAAVTPMPRHTDRGRDPGRHGFCRRHSCGLGPADPNGGGRVRRGGVVRNQLRGLPR